MIAYNMLDFGKILQQEEILLKFEEKMKTSQPSQNRLTKPHKQDLTSLTQPILSIQVELDLEK